MTAEVDRRGGVVDLVRRQDGQVVVSPSSNREPMQLLEVAEMVIVWRFAERHAPQCFALAAASEYCWLELRATQCCSSPAETVSGCTPV